MKKLFISVLLLTLSGVVLADGFSKASNRTGKWEFGLLLNQADSWDVSGANNTTIDVDSDTGWGFLLGYNFNEHLNLAFEYSHNAQDYDASIIPEGSTTPESIQHTLDNDAFNFNLSYYFLDKAFTPYVSGGLGWTYLDSNVASSDVSTGCWWDPWLGYICAPYYSTYSDNAFSYTFGAGLRWDVNRNVSLRASIDRKYMDIKNLSNANLYVGKLGVSWMY